MKYAVGETYNECLGQMQCMYYVLYTLVADRDVHTAYERCIYLLCV